MAPVELHGAQADMMDRTMFGYSPSGGTSVLMRHADWLFLDMVLASHPEWTNLVETGSYYGLTSLYLGVIAKLRGGQLHTFDNIDQRKREVVEAWPDCVHFCHEDILESANGELMRWLKKPYTFAFFDNGHKVAEVVMYAKFLPVGGGFVVHDCGVEWQEKDIAYPIKAYNFEKHMEDVALELGTSCRAYVRIQ